MERERNNTSSPVENSRIEDKPPSGPSSENKK
jgi:hypothetical protein